ATMRDALLRLRNGPSQFSRFGWSRAIRRLATRAMAETMLASVLEKGRLQMVGLTRGKTAKLNHDPAKRPPKLKGRVANDVYPNPARSAVMPPPTMDTQEPAMSRKAKTPKPPTMKSTRMRSTR